MKEKVKKQKESGELIHIKFEYEEALDAKRDLLSSQMNLLRAVKILRRYELLRIEELKMKLKLQKMFEETIKDLKKMEKVLPKVKIPEILQPKFEEKSLDVKEETKKKVEKGTVNHEISIESQLREIQDRLNSLK